MKLTKIQSKKAQIGSTMTWVIATLVIIVIMGFLAITTTFIVIKNWSLSNLFSSSQQKQLISDPDATKKLFEFLKQPFDGDESVYEFIRRIDENTISEEKTKYKQLADEFMNKNYPQGSNKIYIKSFLRLYKLDEEVGQRDMSDVYDDKEYARDFWSGGTTSVRYCDPYNHKSLFSQILLPDNKKIALCAELN